MDGNGDFHPFFISYDLVHHPIETTILIRGCLEFQVCPSGQIIAISHDLGPTKIAEDGKSPEISGKSRLAKYYNLVRIPRLIP